MRMDESDTLADENMQLFYAAELPTGVVIFVACVLGARRRLFDATCTLRQRRLDFGWLRFLSVLCVAVALLPRRWLWCASVCNDAQDG